MTLYTQVGPFCHFTWAKASSWVSCHLNIEDDLFRKVPYRPRGFL